MIKKFCDFCGIEISPQSEEAVVKFEIGEYELRNADGKLSNKQKYLLCDNCFKNFKNYAENKGE